MPETSAATTTTQTQTPPAHPAPPATTTTTRRSKKRAARSPRPNVTVRYTSFACRTAHVVFKHKSKKTGDTIFSKIKLADRKTKRMNYSSAQEREHGGHLTRQRKLHKLVALLVLVGTLGLWLAVAGMASRTQGTKAAASGFRRLLFIPRYSWPTAPPGPAGCILPFEGICTGWGTRYPPDIFTAITGSY